MNRKKTQRLYREEGLTVRKRRGRKKATGTASAAADGDQAERALVGSISSTISSPKVGGSGSST